MSLDNRARKNHTHAHYTHAQNSIRKRISTPTYTKAVCDECSLNTLYALVTAQHSLVMTSFETL